MALFASVRQTWLRRNTVFLATVFGAALATELIVDVGIDRFWEFHNRGVRDYWHDWNLFFIFFNVEIVEGY